MTLPLLVEQETLKAHLGAPELLLVDLSRPEVYQQFHIPGALFLDYARLVRAEPPTAGLLPALEQVAQVLSELGLTPERSVVAYDDEGGGKAARLCWTLELVGHRRYALLNGGLNAWANEGHRLSRAAVAPQQSHYPVTELEPGACADHRYILAHLGDPELVLWDARSPQEYSGVARYARRAGHIPGAVNLEWTIPMDRERNLRMRPGDELRAELASLGITPDKTVVTYCQTHHRSAYTWFVLKALGFPRAMGYPGSWSDWGNRPDTPVEL